MKNSCLLVLLAGLLGVLPAKTQGQVNPPQVSSANYQGSLIGVDFVLPAEATPGGVALTFTLSGGGAQNFALRQEFEGGGAHHLAFNPDDPAASGAFSNTPPPLADGIYSVTISFDDGLGGGPITSSATTGVKVSSLLAPGTLQPLDAQIDGYVYALAVQPDGSTIVAGNFSSVLGSPRKYLARLKPDGTLDANFDPRTNNGVNSVAVQVDGKILIAGYFTEVVPHGAVDPVARQYIARLNADGTLDTGFDPNADSYTYSLAIQPDGKILIAGEFTALQPNGTSNSTPRRHIARLNADGRLDAGFDPNADGSVTCLAVQADGKIVLGGAFTNVSPNGAAFASGRARLARVNADGSLDGGFNPQINDVVNCLALQPDGRVIIGGDFTFVQGTGPGAAGARVHIARLNADGTLDIGFNPTANQTLFSIALQANGQILIAGNFNALQPNAGALVSRRSIARLNTDGTVDLDFDPSANDSVYAIAHQADGNILIGGEFTELQPANDPTPTSRNFLALLKNDSALLTLTAATTSQVQWLRGGAAPEVSQVTIEQSPNGAQWLSLGNGTRISGGWQAASLNLAGLRGTLRARARTAGGINNGSSGMVEQTNAFDFDTVAGFTVTPTLTAPAPSSIATSATTVFFSLPEPALAGSVQLIFGGSATLVLASQFETVGPHLCTFNPTDPIATSGGAVVSVDNGPVAQGVQTVQLSYRDTLSHPAATATSGAVTVDTLSLTPTLTKPETNSLTHLGVQIEFTLPEAAMPGTVSVSFDSGGNIVSQFTLASALEGAGAHTFAFNPAAPADATAGGAIASATGPVPDGTYSVTLRYRDANQNAVATATHTNVKLDNVAPVINEAPLFVPLNLQGSALMPDLSTRATDPNGISVFMQDPLVGTPLVFGEFVAAVSATDGAGNTSTGSIAVTTGYMRPSEPSVTRLATTNDSVPVTATFGAVAPANVKLATLGTPAISDNRCMVARGTFAQGTKKLACLYETSPTASGLIAFQGFPAPGISNAVFKTFRDPIISPDGQTVLFAAKVSAGGTKLTNDEGLWRVPFNAQGSTAELLLREGYDVPSLPAGAKLKTVLGLSVQNDGVLAYVQLMPKPPLVKPTDDTALIFLTDAAHATLLVRKGEFFPDAHNHQTTVKNFSSLVPVPGSPGHGRWQTSGLVAARLVLADKRVALVQFQNATTREVVTLTGESSGLPDNSKWLSFGLPAQSGSPKELIATGLLKPQPGAVTEANDSVIGAYSGGAFMARLRENSTDPITGKKWASFFAPVMNDFGLSVFLATLKGPGVTPANDTALYCGDTAQPALLARYNDPTVPDKSGALVTDRRWAAIMSYALPYGSASRPVFVAKVKGAGVTLTSGVGLYAVDSAGTPREMLRTDDPIAVGGTPGTKKVKSFAVLNAVPGAYGVPRSCNTSGSIAVLVTFADKTQTIVRLDIP